MNGTDRLQLDFDPPHTNGIRDNPSKNETEQTEVGYALESSTEKYREENYHRYYEIP